MAQQPEVATAKYDLPAESKLILMRAYFDAIRARSKSYVPLDTVTHESGFYGQRWDDVSKRLCAEGPTSLVAVMVCLLTAGYIEFHDWAIAVLVNHGTEADRAEYGEYFEDPSEVEGEVLTEAAPG